MFMPQIIFTFFIMLVLTLVSPQGKACRKDEDINSNTINIVEFKANGLPFTGILGNSFLMYDDATQTKVGLLSAGTPFSLSKGNEEVSFDFEIKKEANYRYNFKISFKEKYRYDVLKLTGYSAQSRNISCGVPLSFYIRVTKKGENVPIVSKIESKTCYSGTGFDYMYNQSVISKRISDAKLYPGRYNVYIKNMLPTQEYNKYKLYVDISDLFI